MDNTNKKESMWERSTIRRFGAWLFSWKTIRRFLFVVLGGITVVILFYQVENLRGRHAWNNYRQEWDAKGERFALKDFVPAPVPDDQNFAATPLLASLLDYRRTTNGIVYNHSNDLARLKMVSEGLSRGGRSGIFVYPGSVDRGTFANLEETRAFFLGNTNFPQPASGGSAAQDIIHCMSMGDTQVQELMAAMKTRPLSRFPVAYDEEMPFNILLPHLASAKGICSALQWRAVARLDAGQAQSAFEELQLGFRMADSIQNESFLITHLVRIAILSLELQVVREGIARHAWTEPQLVWLQKQMENTDLIREFGHVMRSERASCLDTLDYLRRQRFSVNSQEFWYAPDGEENKAPWTAVVMKYMPGGWYDQNKVTIARMHQQMYLPVLDPVKRRYVPVNENEESKVIGEMRNTPYSFLGSMLLPAVSRVSAKSARMQMFVDEARVACALERYRLSMGRLPAALSELAPQFMASVPNDIMDGQPLRYKTLPNNGYLIYSLGSNRVDDGGMIWASKFDSSFGRGVAGEGVTLWTKDDKGGDWVWLMPGDYKLLLAQKDTKGR